MSSKSFGSVFLDPTEPKIPKHRNFGIFGSVRSSTIDKQGDDYMIILSKINIVYFIIVSSFYLLMSILLKS